METDRSLALDPKLIKVLFIIIRRTYRISIVTGDISITRRIPPIPGAKQAGVSSDGSVTCQRSPVGDPFNDEQWSDDQRNQLAHQEPIQRLREHKLESQKRRTRKYLQRYSQRPTVLSAAVSLRNIGRKTRLAS